MLARTIAPALSESKVVRLANLDSDTAQPLAPDRHEAPPAEPMAVERCKPSRPRPTDGCPADADQAARPGAGLLSATERLPQVSPTAGDRRDGRRVSAGPMRWCARITAWPSGGAVVFGPQEFLRALGMVARALDIEQQSRNIAGLDGRPHGTVRSSPVRSARGWQSRSILRRWSRFHRTPVLKQGLLRRLSPVVAQQRYYTYAQEQFGPAAGAEAAPAAALYGLGKSAPQVHPGDATICWRPWAKQVACYQAALLADGRVSWAANELGVIFA